MNTDNSEAMRLADWHDEQAHGWWRAAEFKAVDRAEPVKSSLLRKATFHKNSAALLRQQSERIAELELQPAFAQLASDLAVKLADTEAERDQLRAEVIANRERDALKLAALHIHSEMRSIVQAGGSNEAIGREFRKRVILDVEDEVVKLRAEVERLRVDAERWEWIADGNNFDESFALLTDPKLTTYELTRAVDAARTTHKDEG